MAKKKATAKVVPVGQVQEEVAALDAGVTVLVENPGKREIFLPFIYDRSGLALVTLQTWGRPLRYFETADDEMLTYLWGSTNEGAATRPKVLKTAGVIKVSEEFSWNVSYVVHKLLNDYYFRQGAGSPLQRTPITSLNDVFNTEMPAEMRLAIQQVITTELAE